VLYWEGKPTLIDFPQVISPHQNRNAYPIFERDMRRLCEYFITQGLSLDPQHLARDLWKAHGFRLLPEVHPSLLDGENPSTPPGS
jgi:serine/threonine-protein kinase RIO1